MVALSIPFHDQPIGADFEVTDLNLLRKHAHEFSTVIVNAKTDRSFQWRRQKTDADAARG